MTIGKRFVSLSIPSGKEFLYLGGGAIIYFMVARLSLTFVLEPEGIAAIWPPSGIFLASILICRRHLRPWLALTLFATDLVAELFAGTPLNVSIIYALALTGDAVLGAWLLLRFVGAPITFTRVGEVFCFLILVVLGSNAVMSLVAAAGSMLLPETDFWNSFRWWMISDGIGSLLLTPFIIGWFPLLKRGLSDRTPKRITEAVSLSFLLVVASYICFAYAPEQGQFSLLATYFLLPPLIWAALRFGLRGATLALLTLAVFAVRYAVSGQGVEVQFFGLRLDVLIVMQLYLAVMAVPTLFLTAVMGEYQREESAARESEARLRLAVSASNVGLWDWNLKSNSVYFSPEWKSQIGYRDDEISDSFEEWQSRVHPDDLEPTLHAVQGFLNHPHGKHKVEFRFRHKDGSYRWIYTEADVVRDAAGKPVQMFGCHIDITPRKQAEAKLQDAKEFAENLIRTANVIFVRLDYNGNVVQMNEVAEKITGYSQVEVLGRNWFETLVPRQHYPYVWETFEQITSSGNVPDIFENPILTKDGEERQIIWKNNTVLEGGRVIGTISFGMDITERKQAELALRESEEKFANAFHVSPAALSITRVADGKFLDVNEAFLQLFEYDRAEVIGHTSTELKILTQAERAPLIAAQLATGGLKNAELLAHARSGKEVNLMFSSKPMELDGEPCHITVMIDITERKRAEDERQRFVMLVDSSSEFIGMCNLDLQPLYVNPAGVRMVGLPDMAAACRVKVQDYFFPEDRPFIQDEFFPRVLREGHGVVEIRLRHFQTGEPIWMSYYLFHVRNKDGAVIGWATVSRDITERRRMEEERQKSEQRYRALFENMSSGFVLFEIIQDDRGTPVDLIILAANAKFEQTTGLNIDQVIDKRLTQVLPGIEKDTADWIGTYGKVAMTGEARQFEQDSELLGIYYSVTAYQAGPKQCAVIFLDITERKRAEMELRKIKDELELRVQERTAQLARERDRAEAADRVKSAFLATMSHELRTPLNSIIGFTGILLQRLPGALNEEQEKQLAIVKRAGQHLLNLVNDVLDISKIEAGELQIDIEPVDLSALLQLTADKFGAEAAVKGLKFILDTEPGIGMVDSNERRLEQVFNNFISNALKFTDQGEIRLICRRQGEAVRIEVRDTGIGIAAADIAKLFKPFSQLESNPKRVAGGTGLGLAINRRIVEALGGETGVTSTPGVGSCFHFTLPIHQKPS